MGERKGWLEPHTHYNTGKQPRTLVKILFFARVFPALSRSNAMDTDALLLKAAPGARNAATHERTATRTRMKANMINVWVLGGKM